MEVSEDGVVVGLRKGELGVVFVLSDQAGLMISFV